MTGWWLLLTPLKNDGVKVTWDDYSQYICIYGRYRSY